MDGIGRLRVIPGRISEHMGRTLADLASDVPGDQAIVDIGPDRARTASYLGFGARAGNYAQVYGIDEYDPRRKQTALLALRQQGLTNVMLVDGTSTAVAASWGSEVGLLHAATKEDLEPWRPHLVDDAIVMFDDGDGLVILPEPGDFASEATLPETDDVTPATVETEATESDPKDQPDKLWDNTIPELRHIAELESLELRADLRKGEIIAAIREARSKVQ